MEVLGRMTFTRHSGADFEANRTGRRRGEQLPGVDVVDAREPEPGRAGSSGTRGGTQQQLMFATPAPAPAAAGAAGKRPAEKRQLWNGTVNGQQCQHYVYKPDVPAEDQRWVLILEVKPDKTKKYFVW